MSMKRAAKQLRAKQRKHRLYVKRLSTPDPRVGMVTNWLRSATVIKRPDWVSDRVWQLVVNALPRRKYGKLVRRMQAKTLGISTRSY